VGLSDVLKKVAQASQVARATLDVVDAAGEAAVKFEAMDERETALAAAKAVVTLLDKRR